MDHVPPTNSPRNTSIAEQRDAPFIDFSNPKAIESLKLEVLTEGKKLTEEVIDHSPESTTGVKKTMLITQTVIKHSKTLTTDDEKLMFMTQVMSKFYHLRETSRFDQDMSDILDKFESELIIHVTEKFPELPGIHSAQTLTERIADLGPFPSSNKLLATNDWVDHSTKGKELESRHLNNQRNYIQVKLDDSDE